MESTQEFVSYLSTDTLRKMNRAIKNERADITIARAEVNWNSTAGTLLEITDLQLADVERIVMREKLSRPASSQ